MVDFSQYFPKFLIDSWNYVPTKVKIGIGSLIGIIIILALLAKILKGFFDFFNILFSPIRNLYFFLKLKFPLLSERNRIQILINWKKRNFYSKKNYQSRKVKVKNVYDKEQEDTFIRSSLMGYVAVIKNKLGDNCSKNLLNAVIHWVTIDYMGSVRKYLNPELATAMIYCEISNKLREMKDYEAEKLFIGSMADDKFVREFADIIDDLVNEGIYDNIYLPYLRNLSTYKITNPALAQTESINLLKWLNDYDKRLTQITSFTYFPKTNFLYVKLEWKPEDAHIRRAIQTLGSKDCQVLIVSGWLRQKSSADQVAWVLSKNYKYPHIIDFTGKRRRPNADQIQSFEYEGRVNHIIGQKKEVSKLFI